MSKTVLFVSDIHLSHTRPDKTALLCELLRQAPERAGGLYILGDMFDFLAGDYDRRSPVPEVFAAISRAVDCGLEVYFMQGNREFIIGHGIVARSGMRLLPDPHLLLLDGMRVLLSHGDMLCTSDVGYMRFRRFISSRWVQYIMRRLPPGLLHTMSDYHRDKTEQKHFTGSQVDVTVAAVAALMARHDARVLIHGHTHIQGTHSHSVNDKTVVRYVLGDWLLKDSLLAFSGGSFSHYRVRDWLALR